MRKVGQDKIVSWWERKCEMKKVSQDDGGRRKRCWPPWEGNIICNYSNSIKENKIGSFRKYFSWLERTFLRASVTILLSEHSSSFLQPWHPPKAIMSRKSYARITLLMYVRTYGFTIWNSAGVYIFYFCGEINFPISLS